MAKRWLNALDVEVAPNGAPLLGAAGCGSLAGGTKLIADPASPEPLVAQPTPCRMVWVGARVDADGQAVNTKPVFLGDAAEQNIPLLPSNFEGWTIAVDDASKLYVRAGVAGEGIAYRIFA